MIRLAILTILSSLFLWAPWMDTKSAESITATILNAYGPMPARCFDAEGRIVQEGVSVRWYPMGRMVHSCTGDYVVWFWGDVKELGGVSKKAFEIQAVQSKAMNCEEVLKRSESRKATSTDSRLVRYEGRPAGKADVSLFPEAEKMQLVLSSALRDGVDFAGRFAVAEYSCGTGCLGYSVIDVETGLLVAHDIKTEYGAKFSPNQTILITNPIEKLPALPDSQFETESMALSLARLPREYYRLTHDLLSNTRYLVRECVENATTGYVEVEDNRIGVVTE
jgi:hypothetical protein